MFGGFVRLSMGTIILFFWTFVLWCIFVLKTQRVDYLKNIGVDGWHWDWRYKQDEGVDGSEMFQDNWVTCFCVLDVRFLWFLKTVTFFTSLATIILSRNILCHAVSTNDFVKQSKGRGISWDLWPVKQMRRICWSVDGAHSVGSHGARSCRLGTRNQYIRGGRTDGAPRLLARAPLCTCDKGTFSE
jgi:hypothetical protein